MMHRLKLRGSIGVPCLVVKIRPFSIQASYRSSEATVTHQAEPDMGVGRLPTGLPTGVPTGVIRRQTCDTSPPADVQQV